MASPALALDFDSGVQPLLVPVEDSAPDQASEIDPTAAITVPVQENTMNVFHRDNLRFETADKLFTFRIGGRMHMDWTFISGDDALTELQTEDNLNFRRARIHFAGTMYERFGFKVAYEFSGGDTDFRDAYLETRDLFGGVDLLLGQFKEPFGLEWQNTSNDMTFIERSVADALNPTRSTGAMLAGDAMEGDLTWRVGFFGSNPDQVGLSNGDGDYALTARATWASRTLLGEENDESLLHFGVNYTTRSSASDFDVLPEFHSLEPYVGTQGALAGANGRDVIGLESAGVLGPFSWQAEYFVENVDGDNALGPPNDDDPTLEGYYAQASYFLTGESRPYSKGRFRRIRPRSNWNGFGDGTGAWELAARYSSLHLDEAATDQVIDNITLAANWYLNPSIRVMTNVILSENDQPDSDAEALAVRMQVTF